MLVDFAFLEHHREERERNQIPGSCIRRLEKTVKHESDDNTIWWPSNVSKNPVKLAGGTEEQWKNLDYLDNAAFETRYST